MYFTRLLLFLSSAAIALSLRVKWLPNISFNLPINFNDGKLPCSKKTVVFPETLAGNVLIESEISVGGFTLPVNGEIVLADEATIGLGPTEDLGCKAGNVYYMEKTVASWAQPDVWSSSRINDAMPDSERVPCFEDTVVFPPNSTFTVVLPDFLQKVQAIEVGGENVDNFRDYVLRQANDAQQFILNQYQDAGVAIAKSFKCNSRSGCPCQHLTLKMDCSAKFCERPTCADPIQPMGHCCKICGGAIVLEIDESFDIMEFKELVEGIIDSYGKDKFIYHVGRLPTDQVQVIVLDKNEYDQTSAAVVSAISNNIENHLSQRMKVSGSPLSKSGLGGKLFISLFFAVVLVMAGVYVYYYKVPSINYPIMMGRSQANMFSRFNRRTESVVSLTRRDSSAPIGGRTATAFRNPLYDSKRGRVSVEQSTIEE